jgi:hypothetical protein
MEIERNQTPRERRNLAGLFLLTCAGLAFGVWAHFPLLLVEFQRLPAWHFALLFASDAAGLCLFLVGIVHYCIESAVVRYPETADNRRKVRRLILLGFFIPWLLDLGVSIGLKKAERADFARAAIAHGEVRHVEKQEAAKGLAPYRYRLHCRFTGADGRLRDTVQMIRTDRDIEVPGGLAPALKEPLHQGQASFPIRIAYLPDAPDQAWLADLGPGFGWDLHGFSLLILGSQLFLMMIFVIGPMLGEMSSETWHVSSSLFQRLEPACPRCLTEAVPLMAQVAVLVFLGCIEVTGILWAL